MKTRNWLFTIGFLLPVLLLAGVLTIAPPNHVAASLQPQATVEPSPRYGHTMVTISGTVYLFGGTNITPTQGTLSGPLHPAGDLLNDLWCYKNQEWKKIEPTGTGPSPRHSHAAAVLDGLMYVYGGTDGTNVFNEMWEYDPVADQWTQKPWTGPYNAPQVYENTLASGGDSSNYLYLYGGRDQNGNLRTASYRYNVKTGEASSVWVPNNPGVRAGASTVEYEGKVYLFGGIGGEPPTYQNDVWVFDPQSGQWTKLEPQRDPDHGFPPPRAYAIINKLAKIAGVIAVSHGNDSKQEFDDYWHLDLTRNQWTNIQFLKMTRTRSAAGALGSGASGQMPTAQASSDAVLIFGGLHNGVPIAETLIFQPFWRLYLPLVTR